jgi:hypothetical protein
MTPSAMNILSSCDVAHFKAVEHWWNYDSLGKPTNVENCATASFYQPEIPRVFGDEQHSTT